MCSAMFIRGASGYTYSIHNTATDQRCQCCTQKHPQLKNRERWLHGWEVQGLYLQPITKLQNSTRNLPRQNPESISQGAIYHKMLDRTSSRYQAFEKLLWKPSEDASLKPPWNRTLLQIHQCHQTPSAQFRWLLMRVIEEALWVTWRLS